MKLPQLLDDRWLIEVEVKDEYTFTETAMLLTMSRATVRKAIADGFLSIRYEGREIMVSHEALVDYMEHRVRGRNPPPDPVPEYFEPEKPPKAAVGLPDKSPELESFIQKEMPFLRRFRAASSD